MEMTEEQNVMGVEANHNVIPLLHVLVCSVVHVCACACVCVCMCVCIMLYM